jgi:integrase
VSLSGPLWTARPPVAVSRRPPCPALGQLRDTSNTTKHVRALLDAAALEWAVWHTFRKTAVTWLDEEGVSGRQVANQLGHAKPSMTVDHYMSRRAVTERAALVL